MTPPSPLPPADATMERSEYTKLKDENAKLKDENAKLREALAAKETKSQSSAIVAHAPRADNDGGGSNYKQELVQELQQKAKRKREETEILAAETELHNAEIDHIDQKNIEWKARMVLNARRAEQDAVDM